MTGPQQVILLFITTNQIMLKKTIKMTYLIDVAVPNSHDLHSTITEKLQKYTDIKVELTRMWKLNVVRIVPLV
jgi:hypothetical protein